MHTGFSWELGTWIIKKNLVWYELISSGCGQSEVLQWLTWEQSFFPIHNYQGEWQQINISKREKNERKVYVQPTDSVYNYNRHKAALGNAIWKKKDTGILDWLFFGWWTSLRAIFCPALIGTNTHFLVVHFCFRIRDGISTPSELKAKTYH